MVQGSIPAKVMIFTARIRRMGEGNSFSLARSGLGEGVPQVTYPLPRPGQDGGREYPKVGTPSQGLGTRQAVCLLRSRRRTFLFYLF